MRDEYIGYILKLYRKNLKITRKTLSLNTGVSPYSIVSAETAKNSIFRRTYLKILDFYKFDYYNIDTIARFIKMEIDNGKSIDDLDNDILRMLNAIKKS